MLSKQQNFELAQKYLGRVVELDPRFGFLSWNNMGVAELRLGRFDDAIVSLTKAIEFNTERHEPYTNRGEAHLSQSSLELALEDIEKATSICSTSGWAWTLKGIVQIRLGLLGKAIESLATAIEVIGKEEERGIKAHRATASLLIGQKELAIQELSELVRYNDSQFVPLLAVVVEPRSKVLGKMDQRLQTRLRNDTIAVVQNRRVSPRWR